ncbi:isocitrate lyase/phosphoenolpyruvate mutase family protein [Pseudomonas fluorescens]|uniref:isocitrate lyase/PEP mutase family protein n=1 Tax=Pseudomonas fluorescens TaxID=294 RepID=UPI001902FCC6|nr:isocitrate lyase/phosphoenolpyruvate mutase family protein [Pseudomonas fluorescens]MBD8095452.1 isocitrate lyase/phosphoenolpyruvate mutase family protein [Pseudomonas fluorescens]MBD8721602.1 isocitrate lyase/phosphoenolpyruvate mutase family protein [Pseudomonas fluorescens]
MTDHADTFHALHHDSLLILPNVADAGDARLVAQLGSKAVATSSAAVAWAHGYKDGNQLPQPLLISTVQSIVRVIDVPLSVDIEGGYSDDPEHVGKLVRALIDAGAVGINLEDGSGSPELLARKIEVARRVADSAGVKLFINARCDVYLKGLAPESQRLEELLRRARLYQQAGADGLFAAGIHLEHEIQQLCQATTLPVNVLAWNGLPAPEVLQALGVRRLTAGSSIAEFLHGAMHQLAAGFLRTGTLQTHEFKAFTYGEVNALMAP